MEVSNKEVKTQYILDENRELVEISKTKTVPVLNPIKYLVKNAFEVFVLVNRTENYWISNYGRTVNNINHKDKKTFYTHKQGNVHLTVFRIVRRPEKKGGKLTGKQVEDRYGIDTSPAELVGNAFLVKYSGRKKLWHKDGNLANNWYKNLIYVSKKDYDNLKSGNDILENLGLVQEYIEYENKASYFAYRVWNSILKRGGNTIADPNIGKWYDGVTICKEWLDNPALFVRFYLEHYYEVEDESMACDKDLFADGSQIYSPSTVCILPQALNTMLANCKKHYYDGEHKDNSLPLGVSYNSKSGKYYSKIKFSGSHETQVLSEWDTKEEAFADYKRYKQVDILMMAVKYKDKIPDYIYRRLLTIEVKPY